MSDINEQMNSLNVTPSPIKIEDWEPYNLNPTVDSTNPFAGGFDEEVSNKWSQAYNLLGIDPYKLSNQSGRA